MAHHGPAPFERLPPETVELVLELAVRTGNRRKACLHLALVAKQFCRPALRALYRDLAVIDRRQYEGLMTTSARTSQHPAFVSTRRLYLVLNDPMPHSTDHEGQRDDKSDCGGVQGIPTTSAHTLLTTAPMLRDLHLEAHSSPAALFTGWTPLPQLTRLHIASARPIRTGDLFHAMQSMPNLQRLYVSRLESSKAAPDLLPSYPLRSIVLVNCAISDCDMLKLAKCCTETLRNLSLHSCKAITRRGMVDALRVVGPGLNTCELRACAFNDGGSPGDALMGPFLNDIATYCPFLFELQICSDEICTPEILHRATCILPLRHLEVNCRLPRFEPSQIIDALQGIPIGRLETLFIGPHLKWNEEALQRVQKACDQFGITFSAGLDLDQLEDPPTPAPEADAQA